MGAHAACCALPAYSRHRTTPLAAWTDSALLCSARILAVNRDGAANVRAEHNARAELPSTGRRCALPSSRAVVQVALATSVGVVPRIDRYRARSLQARNPVGCERSRARPDDQEPPQSQPTPTRRCSAVASIDDRPRRIGPLRPQTEHCCAHTRSRRPPARDHQPARQGHRGRGGIRATRLCRSSATGASRHLDTDQSAAQRLVGLGSDRLVRRR